MIIKVNIVISISFIYSSDMDNFLINPAHHTQILISTDSADTTLGDFRNPEDD